MNKLQILARLEAWRVTIDETNSRLDELASVLGDNVINSGLASSIYVLQGLCTDQLGELLCWGTEWRKEVLSAWSLEHDFGRGSPLQIGVTSEGLLSIKSNEELADFIFRDKQPTEVSAVELAAGKLESPSDDKEYSITPLGIICSTPTSLLKAVKIERALANYMTNRKGIVLSPNGNNLRFVNVRHDI